MTPDALNFIRENTQLTTPPLLPELSLHLAPHVTPLWQAAESWQGRDNTSPPFWAFAWPGGVAMARYILDNPSVVQGLKVLDFAAGSGIAAIAAARAGAAASYAADIDPLSQAATQMNAARNNVIVQNIRDVDMEKAPTNVDLIITGDVFYEQIMSYKIQRWLGLCAGKKIRILLADPHRAYAPREGEAPFTMTRLATTTVPVSRDLEDRDTRDVTLWDLTQAD